MQQMLLERSQPTPVAHVGFPMLSNVTLVETFPVPVQLPPLLLPEDDPPLDPPSSPVDAGGLAVLLLQAENTQAAAASVTANVGIFGKVSMGCLWWRVALSARCS